MADQYSEQRLRDIILEAIQTSVPPIVRAETAGRFDEIENRFTGIDGRFEGIDSRLDRVDSRLGSLESEVNRLGTLYGSLDKEVNRLGEEVYKLGVLYEDLDDRFKADSELLRENLNVKSRVDEHDSRLGEVETNQRLMKKVITGHSKQLAGKPA